jgi:hypothetical protein
VQPQLSRLFVVKIFVGVFNVRTSSTASRAAQRLYAAAFFRSFATVALIIALSPLRSTQLMRHQMVSTTVLSPPKMTDLASPHKRPVKAGRNFFRVLSEPRRAVF